MTQSLNALREAYLMAQEGLKSRRPDKVHLRDLQASIWWSHTQRFLNNENPLSTASPEGHHAPSNTGDSAHRTP